VGQSKTPPPGGRERDWGRGRAERSASGDEEEQAFAEGIRQLDIQL